MSIAVAAIILTWVKIVSLAQNSFPDAAQRGALYAQVGRNMVKRNVIEYVGVLLHQVQVSFFGCFKKKAFYAGHRNVESLLGQQPAELFPLVRLPVQCLQVADMDVDDGSLCHGLGMVIAGGLVNKAFEGYHKAIGGIQEHVFFFTCPLINGVRAENAVGNKAEVLANVAVLVVIISFAEGLAFPVTGRQFKVFRGDAGESLQGIGQFFCFRHSC